MGNFEFGESVLLMDGHKAYLVKLQEGMMKLEGGRGALSSSNIVGKKEGDRITIGRKEFILIRPDILDHIEHIDRGAQMILPKDSAAIVLGLGLTSGKIVVEGGAGSGGLTIALLNSVRPNGRVTTYDIRDDHLRKARMNVGTAGLSDNWEGLLGDVRSDVKQGEVDAVVLDIPDPEEATRSAWDALRSGGRFCAYVPTSNQMEKCCLSLRRVGFSGVESMELIKRGYSVKEGAVRPSTEMLGHTGFLIFARKL